MKIKILVIIISFVFLFTYNTQSFATTDTVNEEIENITKNEETERIIEKSITDENIIDNNQVIDIKDENSKDEKNIFNEQSEKELISENNEIVYIEENEANNKNNNIGIANYSGSINIDAPGNNQTFNTRKNGMSINICGWAVSNTPNAKLQCFVDNSFFNSNIYRVERSDVNNLISPQFGGVSINPKAGFNCIVNLSLINTGKHTFKIKELSEDNKLICECKYTQ